MLEMSRSVRDTLVSGKRWGVGWGGICMPRIDSDIQLVGTDTRNHAGKGSRCKLANGRESDTLLSAVERRRAGAATFAVCAVKKGTDGGYWVGVGGGACSSLRLQPASVRTRARVHANTHALAGTHGRDTQVCVFSPGSRKRAELIRSCMAAPGPTQCEL